MNGLKGVVDIIKKPKILVIIGLCGILLIAVSGMFSQKSAKKEDTAPTTTSINAQQYKADLEEQLKKAVCNATGGRASVLVTLDSEVEYVYASQGKSQSSEQQNGGVDSKVQKGQGCENSYVIVKDGDGNEMPLIVTAVMPNVKGVVVNCDGGDDEAVKAQVSSIITTALSIGEEQVCVSGYHDN